METLNLGIERPLPYYRALFGSLLFSASILTTNAQAETPAPEAPVKKARPETSDPASQQLIKNYLTVTGGQEMNLIVENDVFGRVVYESIKANQSLDGINFTMPESTVPLLRQRTVK